MLADDNFDEMLSIAPLKQQTLALEQMVQAEEVTQAQQQEILQMEKTGNFYPSYANSFPYIGNFP